MTPPLTAISTALARPWTARYVRFLALVLGYGALVHVGNIAGWSGRLWLETPLLWRVLDGVLLAFDLGVGLGLWLQKNWAIAAFVLGIVFLQLVPYTLFRDRFATTPEEFATLNGLIGTLIVLVGVLFLLVGFKK